LIFLNQIREKIGVMFGKSGNDAGGSRVLSSIRRVASTCAASPRLKWREAIGIRMKAKVVKNKVAPPFPRAEFDMLGREELVSKGTCLIWPPTRTGLRRGQLVQLRQDAHRSGTRQGWQFLEDTTTCAKSCVGSVDQRGTLSLGEPIAGRNRGLGVTPLSGFKRKAGSSKKHRVEKSATANPPP